MVSGVRSFDRAFDGDHVFGPQLLGAIVDVGIRALIEDDLRHTIAIAQMNEDHSRRDRGGDAPSPSG